MWTKRVRNGDVAVLAFNRGSEPINISVTASAIGPSVGDTSRVRDIWAHTDVKGVISANELRVNTLQPHDSVFYRISPKPKLPFSLTPSLTPSPLWWLSGLQRPASTAINNARKLLNTSASTSTYTNTHTLSITPSQSLRACARVSDAGECAAMSSCAQRCMAAGHCCVGTISANQRPSCAQGCLIAQQTKSLKACEAMCAGADHKCEWKLNGTEMRNCQSCPSTCCNAVTEDECKQGCVFAHSFIK